MTKFDLLRCIGIVLYLVLTFIDRFCLNIADYIYIPIALIVLHLLLLGL